MGKNSLWSKLRKCLAPLNWTKQLDETDIEVANITTCHGMARMYLVGGVVRRTIWVFLVALCFSVCLWQVALRIMSFITFSMKTDISIDYSDSIQFPAVTICNVNSFSAKRINEMDRLLLQNVSFALSQEVRALQSQSNFGNASEEALMKYIELEQQILKMYNVTDFQTDKWLIDNSWQLSDDNLRCTFKGRKCSAENFEMVFTRAGKCYTFRGFAADDEPTQDEPGVDGGLQMLIDIEQDDYSPFTLFGNYQIVAGIKVIVQQSSEPPDSNLASLVMPGYAAHMPIYMTHTSTINKEPWNKCGWQSLDDLPKQYSTYDVKSCQGLCEAKIYSDKCGCSPWFLGSYNESNRMCGVARTTYCLAWKIDEADRSQCIEKCEEACETSFFSAAATYAKFPSKAVFNVIKSELYGSTSTVTLEEMRRNWLSVSVYYDQLYTTQRSSSEAQDLFSFLADLGGQFNLYAGFSLLTYCELVEYVIIKIWRSSRVILRKGDKKRVYSGAGGLALTTKYLQIYKSVLAKPGKNSMLQRLATIIGANLEHERKEIGLPPEPLPQIVQTTIDAAHSDDQPEIVVPTIENEEGQMEQLMPTEFYVMDNKLLTPHDSPRQGRRLSRNISRQLVSGLERRLAQQRSMRDLSLVASSDVINEIVASGSAENVSRPQYRERAMSLRK